MEKESLISSLKANNYHYEDKDNQIIVKLARRYFLKLYIENDHIVKDEDVVKTIGLLTNGKSLKVATKRDMISYLIIILLIAIEYIFMPGLFCTLGGKILVAGVAFGIIGQLLEFSYYNRRLLRIKKMLNLNDLGHSTINK